MSTDQDASVGKTWEISPNGEFRFEVSFQKTIILKLIRGNAEIFGTEMSANREYELTGVKMAIFSYEGATIYVRGECEVEYLSNETPMGTYLNAFYAIETARREAKEKQADPPKILVLGESRHTVGKIFLNYSVRQGKCPVYVNLDPHKSDLLFPGVLAAQTIDRVVDIEEGFPEGHACSYFYGHQNPKDNPKMYEKMLGRLAYTVNGRIAALDDNQKAGSIIIAPSEPDNYLKFIQEQFLVSLIFVVGSERLHSSLSKQFSDNPSVNVLKLPSSGGVVQLDVNFLKSERQRQFKSYFYGPKNEFTPFSLILSFDAIQLLRLGEDALAPSSALPLGATRKISETRTVKLDPSKALLYSILGVSWGESDDEASDVNIAGYVYVTAVDEVKRQLTLLSPCPGNLPSKFLIFGSIKWIEK